MSPQEIAEDRSLETETVKATLASVSSKYRKDCGLEEKDGTVDRKSENERLNFSAEQEERVNQRIYDIAVSSDNEGVALNACKYIKDDRRGRLDAVKALAGTTFNVLMFNEQMKRANELLYSGAPRVVDVESKPV